MPELPEVEHARLQLARHVAGPRVREVLLVDPAAIRTKVSTTIADAHPDAAAVALAMRGGVSPPRRHGKRLGIRLGEVDLLIHLGMSGRWIQRAEPPRHGRVGLRLSDGATWWFDDARRFGCLVPVEGDLGAALAEGLGPDALTEPLDGEALQARMGRTGAVKVRLMEQHRIAGIGNIQATEALWSAGLHPATPVDRIEVWRWYKLAEELFETLLRTLQDIGDGELVYVSQDRERNPFRVYGRVGEPCVVCATPIASIRLGGRVSPFCPRCQADPRASG